MKSDSTKSAFAASEDRAAAVSPREREWDLLVAASAGEKDVERIRAFPAGPEEWEALFHLAERHGTASLMYQNLSRMGDAVPSFALAALRRRYESNVHKSLFLARELIRVLDCLDALGVEAIPYKGIVLAEVYYGDMALRQTGDMDLFVRARDVARIKKAVRDLGYTLRVPIPEDAEEDYMASGYECTFDSPLGPNLLELQWALQPRFYAVNYDMDGLFERAVNVTVAGRSVKTASAEDLVLVLAVHAAKHVWGRLIWLCDIAQIAKRGNVNWDWVQARARELGIERILGITFLLTERFFGMQIPEPIKEAVQADRAAEGLADEIAADLASGVSHEEVNISYFRLMMRLRERRADRLRLLTRLTFTPGPGEWEAVRLPRVLFPLYRVVRLGRLAGRFARG